MTITVHDLLAAHGDDAVAGWVAGAGPLADAPPLTPAEARALASDWAFWARPGQRWDGEGDERVTVLSGGRGAGKTLPAAHAFCEAALHPERWNGYAMILGPEPGHVLKKCIWGSTGIVTIAKRHPDRYLVPRVNQSLKMITFPAARGGGDGLVVEYASSADPKSMRGGDLGLLWEDELGFFYHDRRDDNGNTAHEAAQGALRGRGRRPDGRAQDPKCIITTTPSEAPVIEELFNEARAPWCHRCWRRLPADPAHILLDLGFGARSGVKPVRIDGHRISPLFDATTSLVRRECEACRAAGRPHVVVADVRVVVMPTLDNRALADGSLRDARRKLATGRASATREYAGDRARSKGALVDRRHLRDEWAPVLCDAESRRSAPVDWEMRALAALGVDEVGVFVDPAVTSGEGSCDTGVAVVGLRWAAPLRWDDDAGAFVPVDGWGAVGGPGAHVDPGLVREVLLLEDLSVAPEDVEGAPSATWAPIAADAARRWAADWVRAEDNQGGDEVVDAVARALARGTTEAEETARLERERGPSRAGLVQEAKRRAEYACPDVDGHHRRASKRARWGWLGDLAAEGRVVLVRLPWLPDGGEPAVARVRQQLAAWVPDARKSAGPKSEPRDSADAFVGGCQTLLRVAEGAHGVTSPGDGWVARGVAELGREAGAARDQNR